MKIAICDDDQLQLNLLTKYCENWAKALNNKVHIITYPSAEAFLFSYEEGLNFDVLLLDIEMKEISGMDLAKILRNLKDDISIIFITGMKDYVFEGYHVEALDYILKPVKEHQLEIALNKAVEKLDLKEAFLLLETKGQFVKVKEKQVSLIESMGHNTILHTDGNEYESKKSISTFESELNESLFFRCHRCYLINVAKIESISKNEVKLEGNFTVPIARGKWEPLNKAFLNYYRSSLC